MILDCFPFNDEAEILKLRLEYLNPIVDRFIIAESKTTFSGRSKELIAEKVARLSRIDYAKVRIVNYVFPEDLLIAAAWDRWPLENYARQTLIEEISNYSENDQIILSDVDEIPSIKQIEQSKNLPHIVKLRTPLFYGKGNWKLIDGDNWSTVATGPRKLFSDLNSIRYFTGPIITTNPGVHLSALYSDSKNLIEKLKDSAHKEFDIDKADNLKIISLAHKYQVMPLGRFYRKGNGIFQILQLDDLSEIQRQLYRNNSGLFDFNESQIPFWKRFIVSYNITKRRNSTENFSNHNLNLVVFLLLLMKFRIFQVSKLIRRMLRFILMPSRGVQILKIKFGLKTNELLMDLQ